MEEPASKYKKKRRSCVIETGPDTRSVLVKKGYVTLKWVVCRLDDYMSIQQCYKCHDFSHLYGGCTVEVRCAILAGEHDTFCCDNRNNLKCVNCDGRDKSADAGHSASDKAKFPILRKLIDRKIRAINYGGR